MKTLIAVVAILAAVGTPREVAAQDLAIVNARILDRKGGVIERGSVVVRSGTIVSAEAGTATASGVQRIDAQGRTLMPGFIDAHRHIAEGDPAEWLAKRAPAQMQEFLDAGFTTVLCAICPDQAVELRQRIESGTVKGLRLLVGTLIPLARAGAPGARGGGGGGRGGDPARSTTHGRRCARRKRRRAIPPADTIKAVESIAGWKNDPSRPSSPPRRADRKSRRSS